MINRKTFLAIGFLLLFPLDLPAQLVVPASEAEALKGLGMVGVVVDINDDAERLVSENQLKTDVELTLRRNGIVVGMNQQEWMAELAPYVYVNIIDMEMQNTSGVSLGFTTCISLKNYGNGWAYQRFTHNNEGCCLGHGCLKCIF